MNEEIKYILDKVRELFIKYGIKSVTMDDISHELGISKKTLYQYVADKDDLVGKFVDNEIEARLKEISDCFKSRYNAIEELFEIAVNMNNHIRDQNPATEHDLKKYYPNHYIKTIKARREGVYNYILLNLKKGKKEGLYRSEMNEEIIAKLYMSRVENITMSNFLPARELASSELFREYLIYHIRGIGTPEGIKMLESRISELKLNTKNK